jgi:hypothetical protein
VRFWTTTHAVFENGMGGKKVAWVYTHATFTTHAYHPCQKKRVAWVVGMGGKSGMGGKKLSTIQLEMDL